jgi:Na+-transporting methylmalonyl-CoA/oxaloacetate decarboxylase gamma subunit
MAGRKRSRIKMVDWNLVAKLAGGGLGVTILVLTILAILVWLIGLAIQRGSTKCKE